jgi:hypothetical protein
MKHLIFLNSNSILYILFTFLFTKIINRPFIKNNSKGLNSINIFANNKY